MHKYEELKVGVAAEELVPLVYDLTRTFPSGERFGLARQMRDCAISIPSNLAEGCGRPTPGGFRQFVGSASGSAAELHCQTRLSVRLEFADDVEARTILVPLDDIRRMLLGLYRSLL